MTRDTVAALALRYLTQAQLAEALNISERTLERMRADGTGPCFAKAGRRVLYATADVDAWLKERTFVSTAEFHESSFKGSN